MIAVDAAYDFTAGATGLMLLQKGWSLPDQKGVWTVGEASLVVPIRPGRGTLLLDLALDPQEVFGVTRGCQVTILVDGKPLPPRRFAGNGTWRIPVPDTTGANALALTLRARSCGAGSQRGVRLEKLHLLRDTHAPPPKAHRDSTLIRFGWNEASHTMLAGDGWGTPEDAFVWAIGGVSVLRLQVPPNGARHTAILDMRPHTWDGAPSLQRVVVHADGQRVAALHLWERLSVALPLKPLAGQDFVELRFHNLDADYPTDDRRFHFGKPFAWALASVRIMPGLPHYLAGGRPRLPGRTADGSMQSLAERLTGLPAPDLAAVFEGLGNGCELGLLQKQLGRDRPGLLRFAAVRQRELVEGLFTAFHGVARRDCVKFDVRRPEDPTWRLIERSYGLSVATPHDRFQPEPQGGLDLEARRLPRLADKLMEDVAAGERIFVMRFSEPGGEEAARAVLAALRHYGEADMVWLVMGEGGEPGSVERLASGLIRGHVDVPAVELESTPDTMLSILANAYVLIRQAARLPP